MSKFINCLLLAKWVLGGGLLCLTLLNTSALGKELFRDEPQVTPNEQEVLLQNSRGATFSEASHAQGDTREILNVKLDAYRPNYFLMGRPNTKVQLSLKAKVIESIPVYMAYSQVMIWELFTQSPYFSDLNYQPELFYRFTRRGVPESAPQSWLDISIFAHESNGKGGAQERSWNRAYARYQWVTQAGEHSNLNWSVQAWFPYWTTDNPDIAQYRGLGEMSLMLSGFLGNAWDRDDLTIRIYLGGAQYVNPIRGGQELTLRLKSSQRMVLPLIVAQIFRGYAENLLNYQENKLGLRLGIGF